ncbi:hypothetical protein B0A69_00150 [Chryseobacterium shigense]|uniref:Uncharacterized protein n=1 Tax=Chryseobacterium shigense TaxID=297244 RepID=A0A1N7I0C4_9FLAO|nr:hypothetical protein [Chryseobacterium shigense]PQA97786.1 hypothetical protein B0A69_00150 [Chryseobacterium shigense]SIS30519.1 hypothetical protein SAMN05421639_101946 [Chryseobacterium shigense]
MDYKILYIEDLEPETRVLTIKNEKFQIETMEPEISIDNIISEINKRNPDLILLDYILTEGEGNNLKYCNAPTIASTLRSLIATEDFKERPIVLMSTKDNIVQSYKRDYTSHDLFDYAITKDCATSKVDKFRNRCISFIEAYKKIKESNFDLYKILNIEKEFLNQKIEIYLSHKSKSIYEYSRFIYEHMIRCSGLLIGEDILSARIGISKESKDWSKILDSLKEAKYNGILSESYNRWWMPKIDLWWKEKLNNKYSLRHYDSDERHEILSRKTNYNLKVINQSKYNNSKNFWTICEETKLPLDPTEGLELLDEEVMPWQDKNYISIKGYLDDIEKYSQKVSELDRKEMRNFK